MNHSHRSPLRCVIIGASLVDLEVARAEMAAARQPLILLVPDRMEREKPPTLNMVIKNIASATSAPLFLRDDPPAKGEPFYRNLPKYRKRRQL